MQEILKNNKEIIPSLLNFCNEIGLDFNIFIQQPFNIQLGTALLFLDIKCNILVLADRTSYIVRWSSFENANDNLVNYLKTHKTPIIYEKYLDAEKPSTMSNYKEAINKAFNYVIEPF